MEPGEPITHSWLNKSIERAQTKVEARNFDVRKHLLEYDDVLNEQRSFIYAQRAQILIDEHVVERVYTTIEEYLNREITALRQELKRRGRLSLGAFQQNLSTLFDYALGGEDASGWNETRLGTLKQEILAHLKKNIESKYLLAGAQNMDTFIRYQYVQAIDKKWLDHLELLESLRESVYLRSYGQKNPLTEYKLEGFDLFYTMLDDIRLSIASQVVRVTVHMEEQRVPRPPHVAQAAHEFQALGQPGRGHGSLSALPIQAGAKVGRNTPCPCGSSKKYKHCCGR